MHLSSGNYTTKGDNAMAVMTVKVEGLIELDRALAELPRATQRNVLKRVLIKRAQPIADMAEALAPNLYGDLKRSIGVGTKLSPRQASVKRKMFRDEKSSVEVFAGAGPVPQSTLVEFGSVHNVPPEPYMRPAWDATQGAVLDGIAKDLWDEISKAAARLARKTARLSAK